ncbi:response regulator [Paenibacillus radicis (ex Xue et al. 2023)]|uniref:Response regulator n=1 Tax=Paenibacillus radicis (ex Xue et al. 2023) TaxID=2972489 RepID=A0ABT1YEU8_9BACL|nr:response regulator [Paenibacillus radicis (ex Xue et al. 2023)]MCR8631727.1 response regulator [Paenibacillus radicis (ex Xue et al. 2023)]
MYQLLIVDDEMHVVERLSTTMDWFAMGIDTVHRAYSADEALAILSTTTIDILITDIQMPGMTGLELIAIVREKWKKTKCILLSGYADFSYAQEAIQHGTVDYLLKPVSEEQVQETVQRVLDQIQSEWQVVLSHQRIQHTLKEHLPLLKGNLLNELLQGRRYGVERWRQKMEELNVPIFDNGVIALVLVRMEEYFLHYDAHSLSLFEYAVGNIAEELFAPQYELWHCKDAHDYLVFMLKWKSVSVEEVRTPISTNLSSGEFEERQQHLERTASELQKAVNTFLKGKVSVLVSGWGSFPSDVSAIYNQALSLFRKRIGSEHDIFMTTHEKPAAESYRTLQRLYELPSLTQLLEAGRWKEVEDKLRAVYEEISEEWAQSQEHVLEVFYAISSAYSYITHKNGRQLSELIGVDYLKLTEGVPFRSIGLLRDWSFRVLGQLKADMDKEVQDSRTSVVHRVQQFVELNLSGDVSLQAIADHVYLHPVYLSKIYKLETKQNITDYVFHLRMEKAAYLLKNSHDKIYEIAEKLGYQRAHSFNHVFKKHYGMTPQEYRDQNAGTGTAATVNGLPPTV